MGRANRARQSETCLSVRLAQFTAGFLAGTATTTIFSPMDVVLSRKQVGADDNDGERTLLAQLRHIIQTEGLSRLYSGTGAAIIGSALASACFHPIRTTVSSWTMRVEQSVLPLVGIHPDFTQFSLARHFYVSVLSGIATNTLLNPIFVIKSRLDVQRRESSTAYSGPLDCAVRMIKEEGLGSLYGGLLMYQLQAIAPSSKYALYECAMAQYRAHTGRPAPRSLSFMSNMLLSIMTITAAYPMLVLRIRMRTDVEHRPMGYHWAQMRSGGLPGLYPGFKLHLMKAVPFSTTNLQLYLLFNRLLVCDSMASALVAPDE